MRIIEIATLANMGHRNQTGDVLPAGWAVIPDDMETPNFPFGEITTEIINGVMTVTSWTAGVMPEPEPEPEPEPTTGEKLAALEQENKLLTAQVAALTDQNEFHEELIVELANVVYA